jgi:transcriptional regulator with XRE-family HTH domain
MESRPDEAFRPTARPTPVVVRRALRDIGAHLGAWRRLRSLKADEVADRAGISRSTLSRLESGSGASLENTLRVARALGLVDQIVAAFDPLESDVGRLRADEGLPQRVRRGSDRAPKP